MATPLTDAINALTTYANEVTGKSDTTLSAAVGSLADGYGGVGGITDGTVINNWDFTQSRYDSVLGKNVILDNGATYSSDGVLIGTQSSNATFGVWCQNMSYEFEIGNMTKTFTTGHGRFIMYDKLKGLVYNSSNYWGYYNGGWIRVSDDAYDIFSNKKVRVDINSDMTFKIYINDNLWYASPSNVVMGNGSVTIGSSSGSSAYSTLIKKAKITVKRS